MPGITMLDRAAWEVTPAMRKRSSVVIRRYDPYHGARCGMGGDERYLPILPPTLRSSFDSKGSPLPWKTTRSRAVAWQVEAIVSPGKRSFRTTRLCRQTRTKSNASMHYVQRNSYFFNPSYNL